MANVKLKQTDDEDLVEAYTELIEQWDNHDIQYRIDKLLALRYMAEDEGRIVNTTKAAKRKRMTTPSFKNPLHLSKLFSKDNVDDDEGLFAYAKKEPKEDTFLNFASQQDNLYDNSDSEEQQRRAKATRNGRSSASVAPSLFTTPTIPAKSKVRGTPYDPHKVRIFVGNRPQQFFVKTGGLEERSPLLFNMMSHHRAEGSYIMSPLLSSITPEDFQPIAEILDHGEYRPNLLDDGTRWARLENISTNAQRAEELLLSGIRYCHAQQVEMADLQLLIFRKVKLLGDYPAFELLSAVHMWYREDPPDNEEMHEFLLPTWLNFFTNC